MNPKKINQLIKEKNRMQQKLVECQIRRMRDLFLSYHVAVTNVSKNKLRYLKHGDILQ